jgi:hypothetical protein
VVDRVSATRAEETRTLTFRVTDVPDLPVPYSPTVVPETVEITYRWLRPEDRPPAYRPGQARVKVSGRRRLVSGQLGLPASAVTRELWNPDTYPAWVTDLVAANLPEDWDL